MEFRHFDTTRKGEIGEKIVDQYLVKHGLVYVPLEENKSHLIDRLLIKDGKLFHIDIKTKSHRIYYADTSFDYADYEKYKWIEEKGYPVIILFVDEMERKVYGNYLHKLAKPVRIGKKIYPIISKMKNCNVKTITFPLANMKTIFELSEKQVGELLELTHNNYSLEDSGTAT